MTIVLYLLPISLLVLVLATLWSHYSVLRKLLYNSRNGYFFAHWPRGKVIYFNDLLKSRLIDDLQLKDRLFIKKFKNLEYWLPPGSREMLERQLKKRSRGSFKLVLGHHPKVHACQVRIIRYRSWFSQYLLGEVQFIKKSKAPTSIYKNQLDEITGVLHRKAFMQWLQYFLDKQEKPLMSLALIDINGFKAINEAMGYVKANRLLREIGSRLSDFIVQGEFVARTGADEFALFLHEEDSLYPDRLLAFQSLIKACVIPVSENYQLNLNLGYTPIEDTDKNAYSVFQKADLALQIAKEKGRDELVSYSQKLFRQREKKLYMEIQIKHSLHTGDFFMVYQPKVELNNTNLHGLEALIRWRHPQKGILGPDSFIPFVEENGFIRDIGRYVIREVCMQAAEWQQLGVSPIPISINISAIQFSQEDMLDLFQTALTEHKISAEWLEIEITETHLFTNYKEISETLERLMNLGIKISVDDFGTGYSSLKHLQQLPLDILKIDRSFIEGMLNNKKDESIVQAIIGLAKTMDYKIVAEGVERQQQHEHLQKMGVHLGQGYFYSYPLEARLLKASEKRLIYE